MGMDTGTGRRRGVGGGRRVDRLAFALRSAADGELLVVNERLMSGGAKADPYELFDVPNMIFNEAERTGDGGSSADMDDDDAEDISSNMTFLLHAVEAAMAEQGSQARDIRKLMREVWRKLWRWTFAPTEMKDGVETVKDLPDSLPEVPITNWSMLTVHEEPDFGPGLSLRTLVMTATIAKSDVPGSLLPDLRRWISVSDAVGWSVGGNAELPRVGPLALFVTFMSHPQVMGGLKERIAPGMGAMEYPPGFLIIPMRSATMQPFSTTNLVVFDPPRAKLDGELLDMYSSGDVVSVPPVSPMERSRSSNGVLSEVDCDCLVIDPGAMAGTAQKQLATVVQALKGQLVVFLTHHHRDHIEGLNVIQQHKPDTIVLGHKATLNRLKNVGSKLTRHDVGKGTKLTIRTETLLVIPAAGHTDGHLALFHVPTRILVAGDHCAGEGTILLDDRSGGDMEDYMSTTRKFMELRARVLISMHGRPSFRPGDMLRMYMRHRMEREDRILTAIRKGARTLYAVVTDAYDDAPVWKWPAAGRNVLLHVRRLYKKGRLPEDFCLESFLNSTGLWFDMRFFPAAAIDVAQRWAPSVVREHSVAFSVSTVGLFGIVAVLWSKRARGGVLLS